NPAKSNRPENAVVLMGFDGPGSSPEQIGFIAARIEQARIPLAQRNGIVYAYAGPAPPTGLAPSASCEFPVFAFSRKKIPGHFPPPGVSPPPRGFLGM
ncbi:MAG: hypothetical protein KGH63_04275, partial [Candidatus Micrarchaeota archaeon]|nr:hypothetical protein [Candidatus Micrarchaeota archaeon]